MFFDISIGEKYAGRIIFGLYSDHVPLTCENFLQLCKGYVVGDKMIGYKNTEFYKVLPRKLIYGGDVLTGLGSSQGMSIFGSRFPDENYQMAFVQDGDLAMYSNGPNTNASQFIITLSPMPRLQGQYVCFGTVIKGMKIVRTIADQSTKLGQMALPVRIINCGVFDESHPAELPALATKELGLNEQEWRQKQMINSSIYGEFCIQMNIHNRFN